MIVAVRPLVAPVIPDCSELSPHVKVLPGIEAVRPIFSWIPLQVLCEVEVVTLGKGLTVTVTNTVEPEQPPDEDTGVTLYTWVP